MRHALLLVPLLCGCFATTGELDEAVASITDRIDVAANSAAESAAAAREAWKQGEITYDELQKRLQDIRAATLDVAKDTTREVMDGLKDTLANRPEVAAGVAADAAKWGLPGAPGEILALLLTGVGTYFASKKSAETAAKREAETANRKAEDLAYDIELARVQRLAEGKK